MFNEREEPRPLPQRSLFQRSKWVRKKGRVERPSALCEPQLRSGEPLSLAKTGVARLSHDCEHVRARTVARHHQTSDADAATSTFALKRRRASLADGRSMQRR